MNKARSHRVEGVGLAAALALVLSASCASVRPVREVIGDGSVAGTETAGSEADGPAVGERTADGRLVIASRPPADAGTPGAGTDAAAPGQDGGGAAEDAAPEAGESGSADAGDGASGSSATGSAPDSDAAEDRLEAPDELPPRPELRGMLAERMEAYDERCRELLDALDEAGEDATYEQLVDAARALVFNADLRIQNDVVFRFDPADLPDVETLIAAEDDVSSELKSDVRSLAKSSRDLANRAMEMRDDDAAARLFSTLGTGLYLWSLGPLEALANGAATTLPRRVKSLANDHPAFEGASPLRLKGRFQSRAPWPYKDIDGGVDTLQRAVEIAPIPLNLLFLGDAHWLNDDAEAARDAWGRATEASADPETKAAAPAIREIARMRLLASEEG